MPRDLSPSVSSSPPGGPRRRWAAAAGIVAAVASAVTGVGAAALPVAAAHADGWTSAPGDVVVYRVGDGSAALSGSAAPVFLDEYSPSGTLVHSTPLPTAANGAQGALTGSGSAASEGGLTLSADGRYLVATGYDAALGTSGLSSSAAKTLPRTVARVDASGAVDTSTVLTDFADGNNPRSAVSSDGTGFWVGGAAGGVRYVPLGGATSTEIVSNTYKNVRQLEITDGQLYTSADPTKAGLTVATVGSGLPTTGSLTPQNLPFAVPATAPGEPYGYALLTLAGPTTGPAGAPDTLYVADNAAGAIVKYGLSNGSWVQQGSTAVPGVTGLTAQDEDGTVQLYATSPGDGTTGTLYSVTDDSGIGGTLDAAAQPIATAPDAEAFRGVAFAPGTVTGHGGGGVAGAAPLISADQPGLPGTLSDGTDGTDAGNPTLGLTLGVPTGDGSGSGSGSAPTWTVNDLTVTAASSDQSVVPDSGITVTGTGAHRTVAVVPAGVGRATLTLTATAPDGSHASVQVPYGASAPLGDSSQRYLSGAGNASAAIDVGDGYLLVADDESDVLRLYHGTVSGPPVRTFDFTSQLPYGTAEVDLESAARSGDTIYWEGSMSTSSSGALAPSRSTLFATTVTGSGADTQLGYAGSYTGLASDLVAWDYDNGHGLGADYLGLAASAASGTDGHEADALNVEGMEFAPGADSTTAYLGFRAPLEPTTDRHLALVVPVTNLPALTADDNGTGPGSGAGPTHAAFGQPILMDLGGRGIRDMRRNADGQYLIIAGSADGSNDSFALYSWDGVPSDPPVLSSTALPIEPAAPNQGAWETVVSVPDPLTAGAPVQLIEDNGDTAWYGDGATSKSGLPSGLQKDLSQVFSYAPGTPTATTTTLASAPAAPGVGQQVTWTATVAAPPGSPGTADAPTGTVSFTAASGPNAGATLSGCSAVPLAADGTASCTVSYTASGSTGVVATYSGDPSYAASSSPAGTVAVAPATVTVTLAASPAAPVTGQRATLTARVAAPAGNPVRPTGTVRFQAGGATPAGCAAVPVAADGSAVCTVAKGFAAGSVKLAAAYSGDAGFAPAAAPARTLTVAAARTTTSVAGPASVGYGGRVTLRVAVAAVAPGSGTPGGSVRLTVGGRALPCGPGGTVTLSGGAASCTVPASALAGPGGRAVVHAAYSGSSGFTASTGSRAETVGRIATRVRVAPGARTVRAGHAETVTVTLSPAAASSAALHPERLKVTVKAPNGRTVTCTGGHATGRYTYRCTLTGSRLTASGSYRVTAAYPGDTAYAPATATTAFTVTRR